MEYDEFVGYSYNLFKLCTWSLSGEHRITRTRYRANNVGKVAYLEYKTVKKVFGFKIPVWKRVPKPYVMYDGTRPPKSYDSPYWQESMYVNNKDTDLVHFVKQNIDVSKYLSWYEYQQNILESRELSVEEKIKNIKGITYL